MTKTRTTALAAILAALSISLLGCQLVPAPGSDAALAASAYERLSRDTMLADYAWNVEVDNGIATVTGTVRTAAQRARALTIVDSTEGITRVIDGITIR